MKLKFIAALFLIIFAITGNVTATEYVQLPGVVHVHSSVSSGLYSMEELVTLARDSGLEVLVMTDHDLVVMEYGIFPFRNIFKKRVERNSVLKFGPDKYLSLISQINQRQKDVLVVPGVQSSPFYYWSGSPLGESLTAHDYRKELLLVGMMAPDDYRNLPILHRGFSIRYVKELLPQWIILLISFALGIYLFFQYGRLKIAGILIGLLSILLLINHHPFQSSRFDPYHGDQGIAPFQEVIEYVRGRGGLSFWAHPESNYSKRGRKLGPIKLMTTPYADSLSESKNYTGFSAVYGDEITITDPGKKWDQLLSAYSADERAHPVWGIAGSNFHGEIDGVKLDEFQTVFLARSKSMLDIVDALSKGRVYAKLKGKGKGLRLDEFKVEDKGTGGVAVMGEEVSISAYPAVTGKVSSPDGLDPIVKVVLIKAGTVLQTFEGRTPLEFYYEDKNPWTGKTYYRLEVRGAAGGRLLSNPIFIERKMPLSDLTARTGGRAGTYQGAAVQQKKLIDPATDSKQGLQTDPITKQEILSNRPPGETETSTRRVLSSIETQFDRTDHQVRGGPRVVTTVPVPYSIQIGSFPSMDMAEKAVSDYRKIDLPVYFVKVDLGKKGIWWRLYTGYFKTRGEAQSAKDKYSLTSAKIQRTPYANLIDTLSSEKEIAAKLQQLKTMNYSPYIIKGADKRQNIYLGAYITVKGAQDLLVELEANGITSQVVKRVMASGTSPNSGQPPAEDRQKVPLGKAENGKKKTEAGTKATASLQEGPAPYSIQVASLPSYELARKMLDSYAGFDKPAYFVKVNLGDKGTWWRLNVGYYTSQQEAMKARHSYNLPESMIQKTPYANLIGVYESQKQTVAMAKRLEGMQYSPYIKKGPEGRFKLYVGAFITLGGAEVLQRELVSKGISNQVVNR